MQKNFGLALCFVGELLLALEDTTLWKCPPLLLRSPGSDQIFLVRLWRATFYKGDKLLKQFKYEQGMPGGKRRRPFSHVDINSTSV